MFNGVSEKFIGRCIDFKSKSLSVVFFGSFSLRKGNFYAVDVLTSLMEMFPVECVFLGTGVSDDEIFSKFPKRFVSRIKNYSNFSNNSVAVILDPLSIMISTSTFEGFGKAIVESMCCGLAVVAFDNFGASEILDNGNFGFVVPNRNKQLLLEGLVELCRDPKKLFLYQQLAYKRSQEYSWVFAAKARLDVYSQFSS